MYIRARGCVYGLLLVLPWQWSCRRWRVWAFLAQAALVEVSEAEDPAAVVAEAVASASVHQF